MMRLIFAISLAATSLTLSGCVAAVFIPVAGGALLRDKLDSDNPEAPELRESPQTGGVSLIEPSPAPAPIPAPTPIPVTIDQKPATTPSNSGAWSDFSAFALNNAAEDGEGGMSALLVDSGSLSPDTKPCANSLNAVLIDLDPEDGLFPLGSIGKANPASTNLTRALSLLRDENIAIYWMTDHSAASAGKIRQFLRESALDTLGTDPLLVKRFTGERKQARRRSLGQTHCLLAIAGGQMSDFDELYKFLVNKPAAEDLDAMLGNGWFLTPALVE